MKSKIRGWWALLLTQLLSLMGFQSCTEIIVGKDEYGCPSADYTIKGTVTDMEGSPVEGIRVAVHRSYPPSDGAIYDRPVFAKDTLYTDAEGKVGYSRNDFTAGITTVYLEDVDGEANGGQFESKVIGGIEAVQTGKGEGWYRGKFEASFEARLEKK